jgi:hypothetical protein
MLRADGPLQARAPEERVQGLRHGPLQARAPEGLVQGLRHGPLQALQMREARAETQEPGSAREPADPSSSRWG